MSPVRSSRVQARLIVLLLVVALLSGYRMIRPDVHESMTRAAKKCFDRALRAQTKPELCARNLSNRRVDVTWIRGSSLRVHHVAGFLKHVLGIERDYPDLVDAVRWPDDPTREVFGIAVLRWAINLGLTRCDADAPIAIDIDNGLLCNSHFGDMQFLHAQATRLGEPAADTHYRITQWAEFLYRIASGTLTDEQLDMQYCEHFANRDDSFHRALLPSPTSTPCETQNDPAWTLTTLFTMRCSDPFTSLRCTEERRRSRHDKTRIYATGALLHLIQDSFAQGHCVRGTCTWDDGEVLAKVECLPIAMFTSYRAQDSGRHTEADMKPVFAPSCDEPSAIDDPVTASAKMLWHIRRRSSIEEFREDLRRVFGREEDMTKLPVAGTGECFVD
jgi:hypothetical protein